MIYFLVYLFLEVIVSVNISSAIGGFGTFIEILLSAFYGFVILSNFRNTLMQNLMAVSYKQIDLYEFERLNLFTIIGAILLIIPGFLTDIIGLLLQFSVFTSMLVNKYGVKNKQEEFDKFCNEENDDVIDVEIIEKHSSSK